MNTRIGLGAAAGYVATIFAANWMLQHIGIITIAGLSVPAGVIAAGIALALRDEVQYRLGRPAVVVAIALGAGLSYLVSPTFAVASATAFLVSELVDMAVYTPLAGRTRFGAIMLSNTVGAVVDSVIFLTLAFGSLEFLPGQVIGKILVTLPMALLLVGGQRALLARHPQTELA